MNMKLAALTKRLLPLLIAVAIVLLSVAASLVMDGLERRHALRLDFSFNSVTTQSEQARKALAALPHPVHAIAVFTPGMEDQALLGLLNRMAAQSPLFTYEQTSLVADPLLTARVSSLPGDSQVTSDSLILSCEATGRTRVLSHYDYLEQQYDEASGSYALSGISYERSIMEALVYLTQESVPGVRLLAGHGELGAPDTNYLEQFLSSHHYQVSRVDLLAGQALDPGDLLLILSPQKDLLEGELAQLVAFTKKGGNILATSDYGDPDLLPNFDSLYRQMGFERKAGIVVAEGADVNAYIDNPLFLTPYMGMTEATAPLIGAGQTRLRLPGARAIAIAAQTPEIRVDPLLTSGQAYLKPVESASRTLAYEEGEEQGQFFLGLLSDYAFPDGSHARAVILGNSAVLVDSWLHEVTYGAQFLLQLVDSLSVRKTVSLDIAPRALVREQLAIAQPWAVSLALAALPLLTMLAAVPVLRRRKRR